MSGRTRGAGRTAVTAVIAVCLALGLPVASAAPADARPGLSAPAAVTIVAAPLAAAQWWGISRKQARVKVRRLVPRSSVVDVRKIKHRGYPAFAVTLERRDGSTLTGFIDRWWGVIFDWKVGAPPRN